MFIAFSAAAAYQLHTHTLPTTAPRHLYPWCLPAAALWGVYMALVTVVAVHMNLRLPAGRARTSPSGKRSSIGVGWGWVGVPAGAIDRPGVLWPGVDGHRHDLLSRTPRSRPHCVLRDRSSIDQDPLYS
jgi:hypothetical protein